MGALPAQYASSRAMGALQGVLDRLEQTYHRLQVSRRGAYSVERCLAFHDYVTKHSALHALGVCLMFPIPSLLLLLAIEAAPLNPPGDGWKTDYALWARTGVSVALIYAAMAEIAQNVVPEVALPISRRIAICTVSTVMYLTFLGVLAEYWRFPIPFMIAVGAGPCCGFFLATWACFVGLTHLYNLPGLRKRAISFGGLIVVFGLLVVIYPTYNAVFVSIRESQAAQVGFILVLPLLKLVLRNVTARVCAQWEDLVPETTIFTVEVFNSLYTARSMLSSNSQLATELLLLIDLALAIRTLRSLNAHASTIEALAKPIQVTTGQPHQILGSLVQRLGRSESLSHLEFDCIRVRGSFPHKVLPSPVRDALLDTILLQREQTIDGNAAPTRVVASTRSSLASRTRSLTSVAPEASPPPPMTATLVDETELTKRTLQLMFRCEYAMLTEYVEATVPMLYLLYLVALHHLPNLPFYVHEASIPASQLSRTFAIIALYTFLELASLAIIQRLLRKRMGFSPVHQLAFVLETQFAVAQSKLAMWMVIVPQFTLVHFGADFPALLRWIQGGKWTQ